MLVKMDTIGLYTNIPHDDGPEELERELNKRSNQEVPTDFFVKIIEIILKITSLSSVKDTTSKTSEQQWAASPYLHMLILVWQK